MTSEDAALLRDLFDDARAAEIDAQHAHPIAAMGKRIRAARIHATLALIARLTAERDAARDALQEIVAMPILTDKTPMQQRSEMKALAIRALAPAPAWRARLPKRGVR